MLNNHINPITRLDYPDPDVIRVGDTYYMVSTTMYFMPGCEILRSHNLVNWEHAAYVYNKLDSTSGQCLSGKENIYGQGMWAASLRYHNKTFYVCFVANDTHKTYLYTSKEITGPWKKSIIPGFYHDNSMLFDDDGKIYIVYGNREIHITELCFNDSAGDCELKPKDNGINKIIIRDSDNSPLGYEGSHFYKIGGKYYIFLINIPKSTGKRTESCFVADKPEGPYIGKAVMSDDRGFRGSGVAQGGIVDTPSGKWYSILFQDSGAVGRIPILMPVSWNKELIKKDDKTFSQVNFPVFGTAGIIPDNFDIEDLHPDYKYNPLVSGSFFDTASESFGFKGCWQFNHEPDLDLIKKDTAHDSFSITTDKLCINLVQARNVLTQRTLFPGCKCSVNIDGSGLDEGDYAGLCLLESNYAFIGLTKRNGEYYLVMCNREIATGGIWGERHDNESAVEIKSVRLDAPNATLYSSVTYDSYLLKDIADDNSYIAYPEKDDTVSFYYSVMDSIPEKLGTDHDLKFTLDHFTGARFGLF
ncbi:MAG: glycoside hydrolase 43 family protein, partial [Butyrivibrio sp.]|nr:glycoside hydrolase 43 family protein [Butyrivibrio sp.]